MNKSFFLRLSIAPALALGAAALLLAPARESGAFSLLGTALNVGSERDFRIFNNFADASTNDNGIGSTNFPGWLGAELALWKGAAEWNSGHGDGTGDPTQPSLGDGGGNMDFVFAGRSSSGGQIKIVAAVPTCGGGGTFAYVINGGNTWRMRFCDEWTWSDGPGAPIGQIDLQGVGCHEFGHSLGLGHSGVSGATMVGSTANGFDQRSIEADDIAGVQAIYGAKDPNKVEITGVSIGGGSITITGLNFTSTNNALWFTNINETAPLAEPKVIVSGVSSTGGGTSITVAIPANAADGVVHVKSSATGGKSLSNGWPVDVGNPPGGGPLSITSITPSTVDALIPGTAETVTISGNGFTPGTEVLLNLVPVSPSNYTYVDPSTITLDMPQVSPLGVKSLGVQDGSQLAFSVIIVEAPSGLVLQCGNGDPLNVISGSFDVSVSGTPNDLHYVLYSSFNTPSVFFPFAELDIGANFSDLFELGTLVVDPVSAVTTSNVIVPPTTAVFYLQSVSFSFGLPVPDSNVQSIQIVP